MKYILILIISLSFVSQIIAQNTIIKGRVVDDQTKKTIPGVTVIIRNTEANSCIFSDASGKFKISVAPGDYFISFTSDGLEYFSQPIKVNEGGLDLGDVLLKAKTSTQPVISNIGKTTPTYNTIVKGRAIDGRTKNPIPGLTVIIQTFEVKTDELGKFEITVTPGDYTITVASDEWTVNSTNIKVPENGLDLGEIIMSPKLNNSSNESGIAEITLSDSDFDNDKSGQNISGLLYSLNDAFVNAASYSFSGANFRVRGYDGENILMFMNGLPLNDPENGRASYSEWGGLNNVTKNKDSQHGLAPSKYALGSISGETNINTCASQIRKQNNISYAFANRSYTHRIMYTYSTGMQENGWSFALSGSKRWANNGYVEGTWYDAYSYFAAAEKKLSNKQSIALTVLGSPYQRSMQSAATQESYDLTNNNYYNPNWGYQNGEKRNAKVRNVHQPSIILTDNFKISNATKLTTSIGYSFGRFGTTALNWYNANDPRPDYYRYLPSYLTIDTNISETVINIAKQDWTTNSEKNQINWNNLYQINYLSNTVSQSARYIVEEQRKDNKALSFNANLNHELNENVAISGGLMAIKSSTHYFKVLSDLLGSNYWLDVDRFAERDFPDKPEMMQNDLNNPNRQIKVGDKFGYDYNINYYNTKLWGLSQFKYNKLDFFIGLEASNSTFWRDGRMKNGRDPENSEGKSSKLNFFNYVTKAGITYKYSGHHYFVLNVTYLSKEPLPENVFVSSRISNKILPNLESKIIYGGELSYVHKGGLLNSRLTIYETYFKNETDLKSFYHDQYQTYVDMILQGIDKIHQGIEFGADLKLIKGISATGAFNIGNYLFMSRPTATISWENGARNDTVETIYSKYFFVPGTPQNVATIGLKYNNSKYWFANLNFNYFDKIYLDFSPERRTELAITDLQESNPLIKTITEQQKLNSGYSLDFSIGKSWKIGNYYIGFNMNINNILDNQELITGGYEQMRFDFTNQNVNKFPPKYYYGYGRTYFVMLTFRF